MGDAPCSVLFVDDDADLRDTMTDTMEFVGSSCVTAASLSDVQRLGTVALGCRLAILDVSLGPGEPTGVDVLSWLRRQGFTGKAVFLTGHAADDPNVRQAASLGDVPLLTKPLSLHDIAALVRADKERS